MGIFSYLTARLFTSKRKRYQAIAGYRGPKRLTRNIRRDAKRALRADKRRRKELKRIKALAQKAGGDPEHRQKELAELGKHIDLFCEGLKKEIASLIRSYVGTESLLFQMKEQMLVQLQQEIRELEQRLFPKHIEQELIGHLQKLQQEYEQDLDALRKLSRKEYKGRFQLATRSVWSEKRMEREVRRDAKKLRRLVSDFDKTMNKLDKAEELGKVRETQQYYDRLVSDLENELDLLMEIAQDDLTVMHKIKSALQEAAQVIQSSPADQATKKQWLALLEQVQRFEDEQLRTLRAQSRSLERREGQVAQPRQAA